MKIYLLTQDIKRGYDTYDSMIVAANTVKEAIRFSPSSHYEWSDILKSWEFVYWDGRRKAESHNTWCDDINQIIVTEIGLANPNIRSGVILASFNAG